MGLMNGDGWRVATGYGRAGLMMLLLLVVGGARAEIYKWVDDNGVEHYSETPPPQKAGEVQATPLRHPSAVKVERPKQVPQAVRQTATSGSDDGYLRPSESEVLKLRRMFERGEFAQLSLLLEQRQQAVERDISAEFELWTAYGAFWHANNEWQPLFEQWLAAEPNHYQVYLARATYWLAMGWEARGTKFRKDTPEVNIVRMKQLLAKSQADLERVKRTYPQALWAYSVQINLAMLQGEEQRARSAIDAALKHYPANYVARYHYLQVLSPRWGGALPEMIQFAEQAQQYRAQNPKLAGLAASVYIEAGRHAYDRKNYATALDMYGRALEKDVKAEANYYRGITLYALDRYSEALADFNVRIKQTSEHAQSFYWRAVTLAALERYNESRLDIERAYALDSTDQRIKTFRTKLLGLARIAGVPDLPAAERKSYVAPPANSNDPAALFEHAKLQAANQLWEPARKTLLQALSLKPDQFEYMQLLDAVYVRLGDWPAILAMWTDYLSRHPQDGRAYLERSGTYFHLEDYAAAQADAQKAADLGVPGAADIVQRLAKRQAGG
ncbi:MAG: DUF4124 domain-containing protein [Gammaproteobacteria bacterium]|nr:DUF4124 domain-containing protein [Gammaproteobacteria bacterium]